MNCIKRLSRIDWWRKLMKILFYPAFHAGIVEGGVMLDKYYKRKTK